MITPFAREMIDLAPSLIPLIDHERFRRARIALEEFAKLDRGGSIVIICGPSNAGKTALLKTLIEFMVDQIFVGVAENEVPVIGASAQTTREGRTTPKYLYEMLLAEVGNPFFDHTKNALAGGYSPRRGKSETDLLAALMHAMRAVKTKYVLVDEAQYMVRARDVEYRSSLVESLKSLASTNRSLVLAGGYEFANVVLSQRAHLAARAKTIHMERYRDTKQDVESWCAIIKAFEQCESLELESADLLRELALELLEECHGVVGILQDRLIMSHMIARAEGRKITADDVRNCKLPEDASKVILNDILAGERTLQKLRAAEDKDSPAEKPSRGRNKPFTVNPVRTFRKVEVA